MIGQKGQGRQLAPPDLIFAKPRGVSFPFRTFPGFCRWHYAALAFSHRIMYKAGRPGHISARAGSCSKSAFAGRLYRLCEGVTGTYQNNGDFVNPKGFPLTGGRLNHETGVTWRKIKAEYIAGGISQRELAEKYDVPVGTLEKQARKGQWTKARKRAEEKTAEKVAEKTADAVADNAVLLERAKTALLLRAVRMAENYPGGNAQEVKKVTKHGVSTYRFKDIAAVLSVLEEKQQKGQATDIEDLTPLAELLKNE